MTSQEELDKQRGICKHHILRRHCDHCDLVEENAQLRSMVLWAARRLHKTYKPFIYDDYEKVTGEAPERL